MIVAPGSGGIITLVVDVLGTVTTTRAVAEVMVVVTVVVVGVDVVVVVAASVEAIVTGAVVVIWMGAEAGFLFDSVAIVVIEDWLSAVWVVVVVTFTGPTMVNTNGSLAVAGAVSVSDPATGAGAARGTVCAEAGTARAKQIAPIKPATCKARSRASLRALVRALVLA